MKRVRNSIFGVALLALAAYLILNGLGIEIPLIKGLKISVWNVIGFVFGLVVFIDGLSRIDFGTMVFGGAIGYYFGAYIFSLPRLSLWTLILAAILVAVGCELLFKNKGAKYAYKRKDGVTVEFDNRKDFVDAMHEDGELGENDALFEHRVDRHDDIDDHADKGEEDTKSERSGKRDYYDDTYFESETVFSSLTKYIESHDFRGGEMEVVFSTANFYFDRVKLRDNHAKIDVDVVFGSAVIYVPRDWNVEDNTGRFFARKGNGSQYLDSNAPTLYLEGTVCFGHLKVERL